jgi:hypothetical protein
MRTGIRTATWAIVATVGLAATACAHVPGVTVRTHGQQDTDRDRRGDGRSGAKEPMPPFDGPFAAMAAGYYRLAWTADGYPGRREKDGSIYGHPLYPIYVLHNYIDQNTAHPTAPLRDAIGKVARAAVTRMGHYQGALVFWYAPGTVTRQPRRHYSALTQARYAQWLWRAAEVTGDGDLRSAARGAFRSLTLPASRGGVLFRDRNGTSLAEVPTQPNSYVLNGWQSALVATWDYYKESGDPNAAHLVRDSAKTMLRLLHVYDAPEAANSRYSLTGYTYLRTVGTNLKNAVITVPGEGVFGLTGLRSRWENHRVDARRVSLVLSMASSPKPNLVWLKVDRPARVQVRVGSYDALQSGPVRTHWVGIGTVSPRHPTIKIPWSVTRSVAVPTNFVKRIGGKHTNVYHPIHVNRLRRLAKITGIGQLDRWATRWSEAMCTWGTRYRGLYVSTGRSTAPTHRAKLCKSGARPAAERRPRSSQ